MTRTGLGSRGPALSTTHSIGGRPSRSPRRRIQVHYDRDRQIYRRAPARLSRRCRCRVAEITAPYPVQFGVGCVSRCPWFISKLARLGVRRRADDGQGSSGFCVPRGPRLCAVMHGRDIAPGDTTDFESIASTNSATGALSSGDSISRLRKCPTEAGQVGMQAFSSAQGPSA